MTGLRPVVLRLHGAIPVRRCRIPGVHLIDAFLGRPLFEHEKVIPEHGKPRDNHVVAVSGPKRNRGIGRVRRVPHRFVFRPGHCNQIG